MNINIFERARLAAVYFQGLHGKKVFMDPNATDADMAAWRMFYNHNHRLLNLCARIKGRA